MYYSEILGLLNSYPHKRREPILVPGWTPPRCWILKIQIQAVKSSLSQELDAGVDEFLPVFLGLQHGGHLLGAEVPSAHAYQSLQLGVLLLQVVETLKSDKENEGMFYLFFGCGVLVTLIGLFWRSSKALYMLKIRNTCVKSYVG